MAIKWFYQRLMSPAELRIGDFLQLGDGGALIIQNRAFSPGEEIDVTVGVLHFTRDKDSRFLTVSTADGEHYLFEFRKVLLGRNSWLKWTKEAVTADGKLAELPLPRITWKNALWWDEAWSQLGGFLALMIGLAFLASLVSAFCGQIRG